MSEISVEQVEKIAGLVKLEVKGQEETLAEMFNDTLNQIKTLDQLDTSTTEPTYQVTGLTNVFQKPGEPSATLSQDNALKNAHESVNNLFATSAVFDRE